MMAMHNQPNYHYTMAHYIQQGKMPYGGLFANYVVNSNSFGVPGMLFGGGLQSMGQPIIHSNSINRLALESESLDLRRSSIDKLRLKAKEHLQTADDIQEHSPRSSSRGSSTGDIRPSMGSP